MLLCKVILHSPAPSQSYFHILIKLPNFSVSQNNDGKIDYLEFESFLNQRFPAVDKEASLYAGINRYLNWYKPV